MSIKKYNLKQCCEIMLVGKYNEYYFDSTYESLEEDVIEKCTCGAVFVGKIEKHFVSDYLFCDIAEDVNNKANHYSKTYIIKS